MESSILFIFLAVIVAQWFEARRLKPIREALHQRFHTEGALTDGQVEDVRWLRDIDDETGLFEVRYRYSADAGSPAIKTHFTGTQRVRERANLAMIMGKPCRVHYLESDPHRSKLMQFPLLAEDIY